MKRFLTLVFCWMVAWNVGVGQCDELFISEYVEGYGNNRAIELYNPTGNSIDLSEYSIGRFVNGATTVQANQTFQIPFGEVINPYETYVIVLDKRDSLGTGLETPVWNGYQLWDVCVINGDTLLTPQGDTIYCVQYDANGIPFYGTEYNDFLDLEGKADIFLSPQFSVNSTMYFNGDDAVVLFKGATINATGSNIIDVVGVIGEDPGDSWLDNNGNQLTRDKTLIRNSDIEKGTGAVFLSSQDTFDYSQYTVFPRNYFDGLGVHESTCDNSNLQVWYLDSDNDNFGDANNSIQAITQPTGYVSNNNDCDDNNPDINPNATESCDGIDNNCNNQIDEGLLIAYYPDNDGDGFGDESAFATNACSPSTGFVDNNEDCDDGDSNINPNAIEDNTNNIDDNCDGIIGTLGCPDNIDLNTWMQRGDPNNGNWNVSTDGSFVEQTINNFTTFFVSPQDFINTSISGSIKVNTTSDDDFIGFVFGYQSPSSNPLDYNFLLFDWKQANQSNSQFGGLALEGFSLMRINKVFNNQSEINIAVGTKQNQPGVEVLATDFATDKGWADNVEYNFQLDFFEDNIKIYIDGNLIFDVDGSFSTGKFGFYNYSQSNVQYMGFLQNLPFETFYADTDGDTFGDINNSTEACAVPSGFVSNSEDCDDTNPNLTTNCPGGGNDPNCNQGNGLIAYYTFDGDANDISGNNNDGVLNGGVTITEGRNGNPNSAYEFDGQSGFIRVPHTSALDVPDGFTVSSWVLIDEWFFNNLNWGIILSKRRQFTSIITENSFFGSSNCSINTTSPFEKDTWFFLTTSFDASSGEYKGYLNGQLIGTINCSTFSPTTEDLLIGTDPFGATENLNGKLDDIRIYNRPLTDTEIQDLYICEGGTTQLWYLDSDDDTFGDANSSIQAITQPIGYVSNSDDCDDNNPNVNPNAMEICDGIDNNCNNQSDEGLLTTYYFDNDGDGFGVATNTIDACTLPTNYAIQDGDCDDMNIFINPDASEIPDDGIDNDCMNGDSTTSSFTDICNEENGLSSFFRMEGNPNDIINGVQGTANGATLTDDRFGNANSAYSFDGNDYLDYEDELDFGFSEFAISFWFNASSFTTNINGTKLINKGLTSAGTPSNAGYGFRVRSTSSGNQLRFQASGGATTTTEVFGLDTGSWNHVVGQRKGDSLFLYLNGNLVDSKFIAPTVNINTNIPLAFGALHRGSFGSTSEYFNGSIDDLRFYTNRTFTSSEVQDLFICEGGIISPQCIFTGDLTFTSQAQIDAFAQYCEIIDGNLTINGDDITDLTPLLSIQEITGYVFIGDSTQNAIGNDILMNLEGLNNVKKIGGDLTICNNPMLASLGGFSSLMEVGGDIRVKNCIVLETFNLISLSSIGGDFIAINLQFLLTFGEWQLVEFPGLVFISGTGVGSLGVGFFGITFIGGDLFIIDNPSLEQIELPNLIQLLGCFHVINNSMVEDFGGLDSLQLIGGDVRIIDNDVITNLDDLNNLQTINGSLIISENDNLTSLNGLSNLSTVMDSLVITNNLTLNDCCGIYELLLNNGVGGPIIINGNPMGCNSEAEILVTCIDSDEDGVPDSIDNCIDVANPNQIDEDGDSFGAACDCNDNDAAINPDAIEICDGVDNNCDDQIDEGLNCPTDILTITCPADITVTIPANETETVVSWAPPVVVSDCPWGYTAGVNGPGNGGMFPVGFTKVTAYVVDGCGEIANCVFTVTVINSGTPPDQLTISCPADMTIEIPVSETQTPVSWTPPTIVSNCPWGFTAGTNGPGNGGMFSLGTIEVSEWVTDGCGNITNCTFNVTVVNSISTTGDLTFDCPPGFMIEAAPGETTASVTWDDPLANSSCGGATVIQKGGLPKGSMFPLGWTCITYRAFDNCNAIQECLVCFEVVENGNTSIPVPSTLLAIPQIFELETQLRNGNQVKIDWYTNGSFSNAPFLVERSSNGEPFKVIETVENLNSNTSLKHHELMDFNPTKGENFYRIRVPNSSGVDYFSNVEMENILKVDRLLVYPNPAQEKVFVKLSDFDGKKCSFQITNQYGQTMFQAETIGDEDQPFEIDLKDWKNGIYYLSMKPENGRMISRKLVVARLY